MTLSLDTQSIFEDSSVSTVPHPGDVPEGVTGATKRALDVFIATVIGVFLIPLMLVIAILIKLQDGGPVLYRQTRCGLGGRFFYCYKFRTMHVDADDMLIDAINMTHQSKMEWQQRQKLMRDPRVTSLGRFLRKSSLDELPQLFNILSGDMSIIGPRPVTYGELFRYGKSLPYYAAVRPGVTGLWQVNGRNNTTYDARVAFDVTYAKTWSYANDFRILMKSVPTVLTCDGAY